MNKNYFGIYRPWLDRSLEILVFLLLTAALLQRIIDPDIWFHLAIGREIVALGALPANEFLVYPNANLPGAFHEWGFGVFYYLVQQMSGFWGMSIVNALTCGLILWLLFRAAGPRPMRNPANLLVLVAVIYWVDFRLNYRVEMLLYLALAFEILLLERFLANRQWKWLVPIPFIGFLLSQAHPSVVFLIAILGIYGFQVLWESRTDRREWLKFAGWFTACGIATILLAALNPYGISQVLLPFSFAGERRITRNVIEFRPAFSSPAKWKFISLAVVSVFAIALNRKRRLTHVLLLLVFGLLAYRYVRNIGLFGLVMFVPIAHGLTILAGDIIRWVATRYSILGASTFNRIFWPLVVLLVAGFSAAQFHAPRWGAGPAPGQFPETVVGLINQVRPPGRIFNQYEQGGYLSWALQSDYQVFIDGRHYETNKAFATHQAVMTARPGWQRALGRYGVNTIVTQGTSSLQAALIPLVKILASDPAWKLAGRGERALLFFREGSVPGLPPDAYLDKSEVWQQVKIEAEANIAAYPGQPLAYQALGEALIGLGRRPAAIEAFRHYLHLVPDDLKTRERLAQIEASN